MTPFRDAMKLADEATDEESIRFCLEEAAKDADDGRDWIDIANLYAKIGDKGALRKCIDTALAHASGEVWIYRKAAKLCIRSLNDTDAALLALEAAAADCSRNDAKPYVWSILAGGFIKLLDDVEGARRCLAEGRKRMKEIDDYTDMAEGYQKHVADVETGFSLLKAAEQLASEAVDKYTGKRDVRSWWGISNVYMHAFENENKARESLDTAFSLADSVEDCIMLANAWSGFEDGQDHSKEVGKCLSKSTELGPSASEWVKIAEAYNDFVPASTEAVRDGLNRALEMAADADEKQAVADGFRHWLNDEKTADAIGPQGLSPNEIALQRRRLEGWEANPGGLFEWLRKRVDEEMLKSIAGSDYGTDFDKHLAHLKAIKKTGLIPHPMNWHPLETVQLSHWAAKTVDHRKNLQKAFCATLLCIGEMGPEWGRHQAIESTIAILIDSCLILGTEAVDELVGLLVAMVEGTIDENDIDAAFFFFGLLLVQTQRNPDDVRLPTLVDQLIAQESAIMDETENYAVPASGWLFGCQHMLDSGIKTWRILAHQILGDASAGRPHFARILELMKLDVDAD